MYHANLLVLVLDEDIRLPGMNGHVAASPGARSAPRSEHQVAVANLRAIRDGLSRRRDAPEIDAGNQDLRVITAQAWDAIKQANHAQPFIFKHGGMLVWISRDDEGRAGLGELTQPHVRHILARVAEFYVTKIKKMVQADGGEIQTKVRYVALPPDHVCADVLVTPEPDVPVVARITEAPVFGPDGSLQTAPGYHAASPTFLAIPAGLVVPPVKDAASADDVYRARTLIADDLLGDFPFASPSEKANAIGLALEQFVRAMIHGPMPLHSFEAPTPGSGKSLLAEALLRPSCGRSVGIISQARDDDEWRKRMPAPAAQPPRRSPARPLTAPTPAARPRPRAAGL